MANYTAKHKKSNGDIGRHGADENGVEFETVGAAVDFLLRIEDAVYLEVLSAGGESLWTKGEDV